MVHDFSFTDALQRFLDRPKASQPPPQAASYGLTKKLIFDMFKDEQFKTGLLNDLKPLQFAALAADSSE